MQVLYKFINSVRNTQASYHNYHFYVFTYSSFINGRQQLNFRNSSGLNPEFLYLFEFCISFSSSKKMHVALYYCSLNNFLWNKYCFIELHTDYYRQEKNPLLYEKFYLYHGIYLNIIP